jgi:hypothetical protein
MPSRVEEVRLRIEPVREGPSSTDSGPRSGLGGCSGAKLWSKGLRGVGRWILGEEDIFSGLMLFLGVL